MTILDVASVKVLLQAKNYSGSGDWQDESGNGNHAQLGSTSGGDTNDPTFKPYVTADGRYVWLPTLSNYLVTPDSVAVSVTGNDDLDLRCEAVLDDWTPALRNTLISKYDTAGNQRSYWFMVNADGTLAIYISPDGTGPATFIPKSTVATGAANGSKLGLRATVDVDNGSSDCAVTFYTSTDSGATWDQLGDVVLLGETTTFFDSTTSVIFGERFHNDDLGLLGHIYSAQILNGIDGTVVLDLNMNDCTSPFLTFAERSSNAATISVNRIQGSILATVIVRDVFCLATDNYFEIADDAALDFATGDDFTTMVFFQTNEIISGEDVLLAKKDNLTTSAGYALLRSTANAKGLIADGSADDDDTVGTLISNVFHTTATVRDAAGDNDIETFLDGVASGSPTTDSTSNTLANSLPLRIGATAGTAANFLLGNIIAVVIWNIALTPAQVLEAHNLLVHPNSLLWTPGQAMRPLLVQ